MREEFATNTIFSYNLARKRFFLLLTIVIVVAVLALVAVYFTFLRDTDILVINLIKTFLNHVIGNVKAGTLLGALYTALFGGLFFVFMPMEVAFITFLRAGESPVLLVILYIVGMICSFTVNYYIGMKMSGLSKKIISPRKFYKIKGIINKYGAGAIFLFNVLPLPAQPLSAILGVFKYNKPRFYFFFILGQSIKYIAISIAYIYIL
ncbi:MAG: VTT domain-containing protein [archaeon]